MMRFGYDQVLDRSRDFDGLCRSGIGGMSHFGAFGMLLGGLLFLGFIVLVTLLIVAIARKGRMHSDYQHGMKVTGTKSPEEGTDNRTFDSTSVAASALNILNDRYAKGEINQEEYLSKKSDLLK